MEVRTDPFEGFKLLGDVFIEDLAVPSFGEGGSSSLSHFVEGDHYLDVIIIDTSTYGEVGCCYNSFSLLFYSLDCSLLSSTYLER